MLQSLSPEEVLPEMDSDTPLLISPKNYEQIAFDSETTDVKINAMPQTDEKLIEKCLCYLYLQNIMRNVFRL